MRKWRTILRLQESGQALVSVLIVMILGSFVVIPILNLTSTNLSTTRMLKTDLRGLYAAEAGVEDALHKLKYDTPTSFPYEYEITDINGMSVDVAIDEINTIAGEHVGATGTHDDWMIINKSVTYNSETDIYDYDWSVTNNGSGNMKVLKILIDFPPDLDYVEESTSSNITYPDNDDPQVIGEPDNGITLKWEIPINQSLIISVGATEHHYFQLSGPPDVPGVEGHGFAEVNREDIGTVWDSESSPYSIIAEAFDDSNNEVITIRAGVWAGSGFLDVSCWQVKK